MPMWKVIVAASGEQQIFLNFCPATRNKIGDIILTLPTFSHPVHGCNGEVHLCQKLRVDEKNFEVDMQRWVEFQEGGNTGGNHIFPGKCHRYCKELQLQLWMINAFIDLSFNGSDHMSFEIGKRPSIVLIGFLLDGFCFGFGRRLYFGNYRLGR